MTATHLSRFTKTASTLIGAFFLVLTFSCEKKKSTDHWEETAKPTEQTAPKDTTTKTSDTTPAAGDSDAKSSGSTEEVRFLSYNLKNYLTMRRYIDGKSSNSSKPDDEINALVQVIIDTKPDVLGICEIGSPEDLKDLQQRLKKSGIDLPHSHHLLGYDSVRTLAIISKYPITSTAKPEKDDYQVGDRPFRISRGILDATIQLPGKQIRFLGVHLKSKRPIPGSDQELMRRAESGLLRKHINEIFETTPDNHLIVYGDFNDTKRTPAMRTAMGRLNSKNGLIVLNPTDSRGDSWTHHWGREDIYSRFDFVMVSKSLVPHINKEGMYIPDPENWEQASDHRAILVPIR